MDIKSSDIGQVKAKLSAVGTDVKNLVTAAKGRYSTQSSAIQQDYDSLKSAVQNAADNPTQSTIAQVKNEFTALTGGISDFAHTVAAGC